ncbi:GNAT family N-acetyltransferase [Prosthecobacter sp.]|uniref:GNAT family N-acetyltransferase n=1 Tax=Prosthecobacter sp. TaxID=1965333 RepID=UPI003784E0A9
MMAHIQLHEGDRADLLPLFRMADESESEIQSYYKLGDALVALIDSEVIGMAQIETVGTTAQIISLAVVGCHQGQGIGCRLIEESVNYCRLKGLSRLMVCTASWESENIAFYLKRGFRLFHVEQGFFTPEKGYAIPGDQVQFEMQV